MKNNVALLFSVFTLHFLLFTGVLHAQQWVDYTDRIPGAYCDDAQWWSYEEAFIFDADTYYGEPGELQCDTWSSRGSKDGSDFTTPFMEYWVNRDYGFLTNGKIRHQLIEGLPAGDYRLEVRIRCYNENGSVGEWTSGGDIFLVANKKRVSATVADPSVTTKYFDAHSYSPGSFTCVTRQIEFTVGDDGTLDFGFNINYSDPSYKWVNWLAWKDIRLYYYSTAETPEPVTNELKSGDYCLRNVATGQYVGAGGKWGTQAVLLPHATLLTLSKLSDSTFRITTPYMNPDNGLNGLGLGDGILYMETNADIWTIEPVADAEGCYTLRATDGRYMGYDGTQGVSATMSATDGEAVQWQLLTRKQMVEDLLAQAQTDATFLISNPRFDRHSQNDVWEGSSWGHGGYDGEYGSGNYCAEVWNTNFDVYQTLTDLPNGRYLLKAQGYYRYNNDWNSNTNYNAYLTHEDGSEQLYAQLYANGGSGDVSQSLQSIASERDAIANSDVWVNHGSDGYGMPFSMSEAARCFTAGFYGDNSLEVDVTNHQLTIGVRKSQQDGCDWSIWDNFELTLVQLGDNTGFTIEDDTPSTEDIPFDQASRANPVECTSLIANADFSKTAGWSGSPKITGPSTARVVSMGHKEGRNTFDICQTLTGMPDGWYRVTLKGFYRYGDVEWEEHRSYGNESDPNNENNANNVYATYTIPYATISRKLGQERLLAVLYANNREVGLKSIFDNAHAEATHTSDQQTELGYVPGTAWGASEAFTADEYQVQLDVPVIGGELRLGVRKQLGYKYDWACFTDMHLYYLGADNLKYASGLTVSPSSVSLTVNERRQLSAQLGSSASDATLSWSSSNPSIVRVDQTGMLTAQGSTGSATITVRALGSQNLSEVQTVNVTVTASNGDPSQLVINELQVSNLDMFLDPSFNYGGWVELWNPTSQGITLHNLYVSDDPTNLMKFRLNSQAGAVPPGGYGLIWFDHNSEYSANVDFKLDMDGGTIYLSDESGQLLTSCTYPAAFARTSYLRVDDGASQWAVTPEPSPGRENGHCPLYDVKIQRAAKPRLAGQPVMQSTWVYGIRMTCDEENPADVVIRCTSGKPTSGSGEPQDATFVYNAGTGLFELNGYSIAPGSVLSFQAFADGKMPSEPLKLYCNGDGNFGVLDVSSIPQGIGLPVLSITGAPQHFYGDSLGVFVTGVNGVSGSGLDFPCNWNRDWERPVQMDYYEDGKLVFSQECSLERFGGWSRSWYPYNFKLKAQKAFHQQNYFHYPFFQDVKPHLKHKTLQVRNGGNDVRCRIKDAALQHIILSSGFYVDCQDYQPVLCYINGHYIGMLNLREPSNKHYALANYGIDTDEQDQLEVTGGVTVKAGTADSFWQWYSLAQTAYDDEVYRQIGDMVDVDEFANYMAAQLYLGGDDWPGNNCKAFKGNDGKFHVVLFDIDQALRYDRGSLNRIAYAGEPLMVIFRNMLQNDTFRKLFIDSYCLFGGSVMEPTRCHDIIDRISEQMNPALALEGLSTEPTATYMKQVLTTQRQQTMTQALQEWWLAQLWYASAQQVQLASNIEGARLLVNGQPVPTGKFSGTLFSPIVLTATAPEGYAFQGWQDASGTILSTSATYDISDRGDFALTALYEPLPTDADLLASLALPVKVNEVSAANTVFVCDQWKRGDWIELYNNTDEALDFDGLFVSDDINQPYKFQIQKASGLNTLVPARSHLIVWADNASPQLPISPSLQLLNSSQHHASFKLSNADGQVALVSSSDAFVSNNAAYFSRHPELKAFVDGMTYVAHRGDQSVERYPDGGSTFYQTWHPTAERPNALLTADRVVGQDVSFMSLLPDGFSLELAQGWNWTSHPLYTPVAPADLPAAVTRVASQTQEAVRDARKGMTGTLHQLEAGSLYKVLSSSPAVFTSTGSFCQSSLIITLRPGWNWVGYPVNGTQTLQEALADYGAEQGDRLVGQDGFATYDGSSWVGTLSSLETGKGYMLYTSQAKTLTFRSPQVAVNVSRRRAPADLQPSPLAAVKHAFPNVMGVIAALTTADGTPVDASRFTLYAYSAAVTAADGLAVSPASLASDASASSASLRGLGAWVSDRAFITVYGQGGETLTYQAVDNLDGTVYSVAESDLFAPGVEGTLAQPRLLTLGEPTSVAPDIATGVAPLSAPSVSRPVGYYSLSGVLVARSASALPQGTYVVRYADGSHRKLQIP